jgi:Arc/MetJ-type ribon-helix-helix transcriptional regulator
MVSVRLSEEEYIALRELCSSTGSRSVSDLTRDAMRAFLKGTNEEESLHVRMNEFCDQMNQLCGRVDQLVLLFEGVATRFLQNRTEPPLNFQLQPGLPLEEQIEP